MERQYDWQVIVPELEAAYRAVTAAPAAATPDGA